MPVAFIEQLPDGSKIGGWRFDETPDALVDKHPSLTDWYVSLKEKYRSETRIMEKMAVQVLLMAMDECVTDMTIPLIHHLDSGCPVLSDGRFISISHTKGMAVVMLSDERPVGIDVEYRSARVAKIAHMFLRHDEKPDTVDGQLLIWCAKEAAYKLFSAEKLTFEQMKVLPFMLQKKGGVQLMNMKSDTLVNLSYRFDDDYVLVYTS
ncbi:MAG: 4'-phosphopantetheinyl transferase superfamily protein [Prevotella sp.]|nr:4'-phosphopantetheinyl transferase superfamily protein [Prevotella sp.]